MTAGRRIPVRDDAACAICGPCRYAMRGLIPGRSCSNGQDCSICEANRQIVKRCLDFDSAFFDRPIEAQKSGFKLLVADLMLRHTCNLCELVCPELAVTADPETGKRRIDLDYCKSCGLCAGICPNKAIKME